MVLVVKKRQMFWYVCTWFEFIIGHMTSMFNFSPLGPNSVSLFKNYLSRILRPKNWSSVYTGKSISYLLI
jgi:hypothetical protein